MTVPNRSQLLAELDKLSHPARIKRLRTLAHAAKGSTELEALVASLATNDAFEASAALVMADAAGLEQHVLHALRHETVSVRALAAKAVCGRVGDDARVAEELLRAAPETRRRMIRSIRKGERTDLADRLLPEVLARWGPVEAARLLGACSPPIVERFLPELAHAVASWRAFANGHAPAVLAHVRASLETAPRRARARVWSRLTGAIHALAPRYPRELLELALKHADPDTIPAAIERPLGRWIRREPALVLELLLRPGFRQRLAGHGLPRGVAKGARSLSPEQIDWLAAPLAESPRALAALLRELPPSARARVFSKALGDRASARVPSDELELLDALPHALRAREAERLLGLRVVREDPELTLTLTAYCDPQRTRPALEEACRASTAEDRARGYSLLIGCAGRFRRGVTETLAFLGRLKNEQDPVRLAAAQALIRWPPSIIGDGDMPALTALVDHFVQARDTSHMSRACLQQLAQRLIRAAATSPESARFQFGLGTLEKLAGQAGVLALPSLEKNLPRGAEQRIVASLEPMIRAANKRESHALVLGLAQALGERGHDVAALRELLEPVTTASQEHVARSAIALWLAPPRTRDARILKLLARDPSTIAIDAVFQHLHRRRQDLLDPYLREQTTKGRFLTGKTLYVLPATSGFERWLPRQQAAHARLLERVAGDAKRSDWERAAAIRTLARIPVVEAASLDRLLRTDHVPVVEAALGALAWTDRPQEALPVLLHHADSDRARVAMYAVPRCARFLEPERLTTILDGLLSREKLRVTVHKEAIRLLGAFRGEASLGVLLREAKKTGQHRDVTIALGHAARAFLDRDAAVSILETMAHSSDRFVAESLLDQRLEGIVPAARLRYVTLLLEVAKHEDPRVRKKTFTTLGAWSSGSEEAIARSAAARILDLEGGVEWREALGAIIEATRDGGATHELVRLARALAASPITEAANARSERDVPARQRLNALVGGLTALPHHVRASLGAVFSKIASEISNADATLWLSSAGLRVAAIDWNEPEAAADRLVGIARELTARAQSIGTVASRVSASVETTFAESPRESLFVIVDRLLEDSAAPSALLALAVVGVVGRRLDWPDDAARRLRALRKHADEGVRAAALDVWTAAE